MFNRQVSLTNLTLCNNFGHWRIGSLRTFLCLERSLLCWGVSIRTCTTPWYQSSVVQWQETWGDVGKIFCTTRSSSVVGPSTGSKSNIKLKSNVYMLWVKAIKKSFYLRPTSDQFPQDTTWSISQPTVTGPTTLVLGLSSIWWTEKRTQRCIEPNGHFRNWTYDS